MKDTDQKKRGYRVQIRENKFLWEQIREGMGTDQRAWVIVGTDQRKGGYRSGECTD